MCGANVKSELQGRDSKNENEGEKQPQAGRDADRGDSADRNMSWQPGITPEEVVAVFRDVQARRRKVVVPRRQQVIALTRWLNELHRCRQAKRPTQLAERINDLRERRHQVARAIAVLQRELPPMIATWKGLYGSEIPEADGPGQPLHVWLDPLLQAADAVAPLLGDVPRRGRPSGQDRPLIVAMERYVVHVWKAAGLTELSNKPDGPKIVSISELLRLVTGKQYEVEKIASVLHRHQDPGKRSQSGI